MFDKWAIGVITCNNSVRYLLIQTCFNVVNESRYSSHKNITSYREKHTMACIIIMLTYTSCSLTFTRAYARLGMHTHLYIYKYTRTHTQHA